MKIPLPINDELKYETELESLNVCPFCGMSRGRLVYHMITSRPKPWKRKRVKVRFSVWCPKCGAETKTYPDEENAIRGWNTRYQRGSVDISGAPFIERAEWLTDTHYSICLTINGKQYMFNVDEMGKMCDGFNRIHADMEMNRLKNRR